MSIANGDSVLKWLKGILIFLLIALILAIGGGIFYYINEFEYNEILESERIYQNIFIENTIVSNATKEEALNIIENKVEKDKVVLTYKGEEYAIQGTNLYKNVDLNTAVEEAYNVGRIGTKDEKIAQIKLLDERKINIDIKRELNEEKILSKLQEVNSIIEVKPINSTITKSGSNFTVAGGQDGVGLDIEKTYQNIVDVAKEGGTNYVEIEVKETKAKHNADDLKNIRDLLGGFTTTLLRGNGSTNRVQNIEIASSKIDGTILYPGEVFSTNEKFGPTTSINGYKPAGTIINGKLVDEYGGGVCQVSSTLYNAILYSELDIVERRNHSLKVGYTDYGYDATLAGTYIDLKFKNSTQYPIYIESYVSGDKVVCNIYGRDERPENRVIKFENVLVESIPAPPEIKKETDELFEGEEKQEVAPLTGYKYTLYKLIYQEGKLIERVFVNNSYYKPRSAEILVGTKPKVEQVINPEDETISTSEVITETTIEETATEMIEETTTEKQEIENIETTLDAENIFE